VYEILTIESDTDSCERSSPRDNGMFASGRHLMTKIKLSRSCAIRCLSLYSNYAEMIGKISAGFAASGDLRRVNEMGSVKRYAIT